MLSTKHYAKQFKSTIETYDHSKLFTIVTHANCADGAYANYLAIKNLKSMGFEIDRTIYYFHNTNNFENHVPMNKYVLFIDITPLANDYQLLKQFNNQILFVDHHPINQESDIGIRQIQLFKDDQVNHLHITDGTQCATSLICEIFEPHLLNHPLIYHINRFDNGLFDEEESKLIALYNKHHINDTNFFENVFEKPIIQILDIGRKLQIKQIDMIQGYLNKGQLWLDSKHNIKIFEIIIDDEYLSNTIADEFYKKYQSCDDYIVITIYHKTNGTKFSFRSIPNGSNINAYMLANSLGGGGHPHISAFFTGRVKINSIKDLM